MSVCSCSEKQPGTCVVASEASAVCRASLLILVTDFSDIRCCSSGQQLIKALLYLNVQMMMKMMNHCCQDQVMCRKSAQRRSWEAGQNC